MACVTSQLASHFDTKSPKRVTANYQGSQPAKQPTQIAYSITYALPGQVGFCLPRIAEDPEYVQRLLALLRQERWVLDEQVNRVAGSIVISYKPRVVSDAEMRSQLASLIQAANNKSQLASLIQAANNNKTVNFSSQPQLAEQRAKTSQPVKQPTPPARITYSIAHAIPGRVRFRVPRIAQDPEYVKRLETLLKADTSVTSERVNRMAASVVITYKLGKTLDSQQRSRQEIVSIGVSRLARLIQSAVEIAVMTESIRNQV